MQEKLENSTKGFTICIIIMDLLSTKSVLFIDKSVVFQGADPTICLDQVSCSNTILQLLYVCLVGRLSFAFILVISSYSVRDLHTTLRTVWEYFANSNFFLRIQH